MAVSNTQYKVIPVDVSGGLHTDNDPINQPKGTLRYALNAVDETVIGHQKSISNERSTWQTDVFPMGFKPIGDVYLGDDISGVILVNPKTGKQEIGLINKDHKYTTVVDTTVLGLRITNQCDIIFRIRRGKERVIYWVDSLNVARTFNFDRVHNFYTSDFQAYLKSGGDPNTYPDDKWDVASFDLIKSYKSIPFFANVSIIETGAILPGSYNFAIQYVDEDLNPTEWITTSNIVRIFNDQLTSPFHRIRGSRNVDTSSQSFPRANKSIKLTITNLDDSFPYYRVAIIRAAGNTGKPEKALVSELQATTSSIFVYAGNDFALAEVALEDILIDQEVIFAPQHITQLENRLQLYNTKGKSINWCEFQKYASKISSQCVFKTVILNSVLSEPNVKNAKSTFQYRGYMPGEVYAFNAHYVFKDGYISPGFHVPGKGPDNTTSNMKVHELTDTRYNDIHNCSTDNYWARDCDNNTLLGKRVRHHRFPFRTEVSKPLFTTSTDNTSINKYRLKIKFSLNPAWTPGPIEYPQVNGEPAVIPYTIFYQLLGFAETYSYNQSLTDDDIDREIVIYDDISELTEIDPPEFGALDPTCILADTYQVGGNERFLIDFTYETYSIATLNATDTSEIFGIEFSNIEKPHPDVIGVIFTRAERTEDDKIIYDNAIVGMMTEFQDYRSFGLISPTQFYPVDNCGRESTPDQSVDYVYNAFWFYNPEFQYFNKKEDFSRFNVQGDYDTAFTYMPTISNADGSTCNGGPGQSPHQGSRGVYVEDVQAGTSYNPEVHKNKDKDDDGFDLVIGYRAVDKQFQTTNVGDDIFPDKDRILYLSAASYQNHDGLTYYNVSVDNKIGIYVANDEINSDEVEEGNILKYVALIKDNNASYANFMTRSYYKEHNNPIMFGVNNTLNAVKIFNGDAEISGFNFVSTVFYDMVVAQRSKKSRLWKIIVGAVLVVASVVVTVTTLGAATPAAVAVTAGVLSSLAISYGVSLAVSGIKFEQFKLMVDTDYEKGLKQTVVDGGVYETIRETIQTNDDTIRWFADRVNNLYIESSVPFGVRSGLTCGVPDFIDGPAEYNELEFRNYLIEKLTVIDRDQGSGRMYKGYATAELYDMNLDYMRFNKEKLFIHLPLEYDCCADQNEIFPLRVHYSEQSFQEERVDNYRVFLPNNYRDIEGEHGEITGAYRLGNNLYIHTREGLWHLPQSHQERVTGEIVSFIGTGEFFSLPPRKVLDDDLGSGGSQHKWGTVKTKYGVFFMDEVEGKIFFHTDKLQDITSGNRNYFKNNLRSFLSKQLYDNFGINFQNINNPANKNGIGCLSSYDSRFERILFTKRDYLVLPDKLAVLQIVSAIPSTNIFAFNTTDQLFYQGSTVIDLDNPGYFENKSFTMSYNIAKRIVRGWHSFIPNYYIHGQNNLYSTIYSSDGLWKHNRDNNFQTFYGIYRPFIVEAVKLGNPFETTTLEDISLNTKALMWVDSVKDFREVHFTTFNKVLAYNNEQSSGERVIIVKDTQTQAQMKDWYRSQIKNVAGQVLATRKIRDWNINNFRDYVIDYDKPIFDSAWDSIKNQFPIDKIVNSTAIDVNKYWAELQNFKDKFIIIRLKFDNFDNVNLILNYILETEQTSS